MGKRETYRCAVCGHEWMSSKEPSRCAEPKCRSRKWKFGDGQERVVTSTKAVVERKPMVMKPRSEGVTDLTVQEGDTCALPAPVVVDAVGPKIEKGRGKVTVETEKLLTNSEQMRKWRENQ